MKIIVSTDQGALSREYQEIAKQLLPFVTLCTLNECSLPFFDQLAAMSLLEYGAEQAKRYRLPVLVEESTLVVPALDKRYPCRMAIENQSQNRKLLLTALAEKPLLDRSAFMECLLVYAAPGEKPMQFKGVCEGVLLEEEQGSGFGYDPLFRKHSYNQTLAQLPPHIKRAVSDRGKAFERFALWLESSLSVRP